MSFPCRRSVQECFAVKRRDPTVIQILMTAGADANKRNTGGRWTQLVEEAISTMTLNFPELKMDEAILGPNESNGIDKETRLSTHAPPNSMYLRLNPKLAIMKISLLDLKLSLCQLSSAFPTTNQVCLP